ncbi:alpha/beta fold hydrolase [Desulforamulus aeronauticus]|uniref:Pimeloyl-ACP methyl ester carboxylesterase n=1 Tax=Desulforamulus aeronauticus DSM 10349 TaxID=1121421 RepID=A0A1M6VFA9_9FIRM|nr:alpha/beta hydrolase [Desulforamulus aeronauticus]SHK80160.1 Pimeloyl-ACP methyl ester carboxylesterase [Desulforamulus aeronauticus DSM 10349]
MVDNLKSSESFGGIENVPGLIHHDLKVSGGPISVYEAGSKEKPAVMMLHGAMYDEARFIWDQMFPFLSKDYHVFALDTPRHGKSRPWEGNLDHLRLMDILHGTFCSLGLERFSLVGLSMGGSLSIEYASLHPKRVASMVLFEPGGLGDRIDLEFITWLYIKMPGMLRMLSKKYIRSNHDSIRKMLDSIFVGSTKPTDPDRLVAILEDEIKGKHDYGEKDMDDWQLNAIGPFRLKWNLLDRIPLIKCPTLWLRGSDSVLVKQHEMERAVRLAKQGGTEATLEIIKNAGHILPLEQPEKANMAVKVFLDKTISTRNIQSLEEFEDIQ